MQTRYIHVHVDEIDIYHQVAVKSRDSLKFSPSKISRCTVIARVPHFSEDLFFVPHAGPVWGEPELSL